MHHRPSNELRVPAWDRRFLSPMPSGFFDGPCRSESPSPSCFSFCAREGRSVGTAPPGGVLRTCLHTLCLIPAIGAHWSASGLSLTPLSNPPHAHTTPGCLWPGPSVFWLVDPGPPPNDRLTGLSRPQSRMPPPPDLPKAEGRSADGEAAAKSKSSKDKDKDKGAWSVPVGWRILGGGEVAAELLCSSGNARPNSTPVL